MTGHENPGAANSSQNTPDITGLTKISYPLILNFGYTGSALSLSA